VNANWQQIDINGQIGYVRKPRWPPPRVCAWLGAAPELATRPEALFAIVQELIGLVQPIPIDAVFTSEPRSYRITPNGLHALETALAMRRIESLLFSSPSGPPPYVTSADVMIYLGASDDSEPRPANIGIGFVLPDPADREPVVQRLAAFVQRWAATLEVASAFVSTDPRDTAGLTWLEGERKTLATRTWYQAQLNARGVSWGMMLGSALCARLGGRERVLEEAPAAIRTALGDGVWLQLSAIPSADPNAVERMTAYLNPLLNWSAPEHRVALPIARQQTPRVVGGDSAVPIRWLVPGEDTSAINIYLARSVSDAGVNAVVVAVKDWFKAGFVAHSDESPRFHYVSMHSHDREDAVLRWQIDLGHVDERVAVEELARALVALPEHPVTEIVVGVEEIG
jgi:hypothetical protein